MQCHHVTCNMLPPVSWCLQVLGVKCGIKANVDLTAAHKQLLCAAQDFHDPPGQAWLASLAGRTNTGQQILVEL